MNNLRQYEKDERQALLKVVSDMNRLHARMGGRDDRPERKALMRCMAILVKEINRKTADQVARDWTGAPLRYPIPGMTVPR